MNQQQIEFEKWLDETKEARALIEVYQSPFRQALLTKLIHKRLLHGSIRRYFIDPNVDVR